MSARTDRLVASAYATGWAVVRRLPEPVARTLFRLAADIAWRRRGPAVQRLEANLRRVVGADEATLRATSRAGMRSYARYWLEVFRIPTWSADDVRQRVTVDGMEQVDAVRAAGHGAVLALPHMGNWDAAGVWLVGRPMPFTTVVERLKPEALFDRFLAFRTSIGMEVVALSGGERSPYEILRQRMKEAGVTCLVCDRDLTASGIPVTYFGEETRMPAGPAMLAVNTGAVVFPVNLWYDGPVLRVVVHPSLDVPAEGDRRSKVTAVTQRLAAAFEGFVREHPQDWHMLQRYWVADLSAERQAAISGAAAPTPPSLPTSEPGAA